MPYNPLKFTGAPLPKYSCGFFYQNTLFYLLKTITMKRKLQLAIPWFMALLLLISFNGWGQGTEDFEGSSLPGSYSDGTFVGSGGITWTYVHARNVDTYPIDGEGIMLRRSDEPSSLSATIPGGIGDFSVDTRKAYTGNTQRKLELVINGNVIAQHEPVFADGADATVVPFVVNDINISGDVSLTLRMYGATGNQQIILDNISWTAPAEITQVATPTISPNGGSFYAPVEVAISTLTEDASIYYTIDGTDPDATATLYTAPFTLSEGATVKAIGIKAGLDNSSIATAAFTFPAVTDMATIAELRAGLTDGTAYRLTGQALITAMDNFNNRKFIQDASGAIMIFDSNGIIDSDYSVGDKMQNVTGTLTLANNMLRFIPVADPGAAVSTGNPVTPTVFTIDALTTDDQAKLVTLRNVSFTSAGNFSTGQNYTLTDGTNELVLRTDFFSADYIGTAIPTTPQSITGVIIQYNAALQVVPRNLADMVTEPYSPYFQFSTATDNVPTWFGANRGIAVHGNHLLVAKQSPVTIQVLDRFSGLDAGTLNVTGIDGGFWAVNDIGVTEDGVILAANGTLSPTGGNFKVYQVSSDPGVAPVLAIDFDVSGFTAVRLGDKITVVGSVAEGTAALYAADGSENRVFKWSITEGVGGNLVIGEPEIIPITSRGGSNVVAPLPNGNFYYTGTGIGILKYSAEGVLLGSVPTTVAPTGTTGLKYLGTEGSDDIIAVYNYGSADGYIRVIRVPNGMPANASLMFKTPVLGPNNSAGNGDLAFAPNADGVNADLYVLDTSDGIGGYKTNNLNLVFPDYSEPGDAVFAVSPTSRDFGTVLLGATSAEQTFTISNTGAGTITINPTDIVLSGADAAEFVFSNITETAVLDLNESVTFTVAFAPQSEGAKSALITINDNLGEKVLHEISLNGLGVDPTLYPPFTQDFNTTPFPPEFWTRFTGMLAETSSLTSTTSGWVHGKFGYIGTENNAARLNIYGSSRNHWIVTPPIDLGDGSTDYELVFDLSLNKWNTANPPDMNGTDDKFAIIISTDGGLTWSSNNTLRLYDNAGSAFVMNDISHTGETVFINLSDYSGIVKVAFYGESTASNADNDIYVDNVSVQEVPENPVFALTPLSWDFGDAEVGVASPVRTFTISNAGPGTLVVNAPVLDNNEGFTLTFAAEDFPAELSGSETVTFTVGFEPGDVGPFTGEISIGYNDGTTNTATVALTGNGIVRPAGSTCANPYVIASLPLVDFEGDTEPMGDDYSSTWITPTSSYLNGNDMVFQFTLDEPGYLSANMTSANSWIGMFILEDCPDAETPAEVIRSATSSESTVSFTDQYMEAGTYFAIVSSYPSPQFITFTLNMTFNAGYTATFVIEDEEEVPVLDAVVTLAEVTNPAGDYVFTALMPGTYAYTVVKEGYFIVSGEAVVVDADITIPVVLVETPDIPVIIAITPVDDVNVEYGTLEADAIAGLAPTTTITDSNNDTHVVTLSWTIADYDGEVAGPYTATGTFTLPEGIEQPDPAIPLVVSATVTVLEPPVVIDTFPWSEDFEQDDFPPNGWASHNLDGGGPQWALSTSQNHTTGGTRSAYHNYSTASAGNQDGWMVTPLLQLPNEDMRLIFWSYNSFPTYYGNNSVLISTGSADPTSDDFTEVWTTTAVTSAWVETIVDLNAYAGQEIYIAFRYQGTDAHAWYFDDVLVEAQPEYYTVSFTVAEDVTAGAAIEGAQISMTGYPVLTTDAQGMATVDLIDGSYTATITKSGYQTETVDFIVDGQDLSIDVLMLDAIINPFNLTVTTEGLEAGEAHLSWNETSVLLEDDFEGYPSFALDLSPWTVYEETGHLTYTIENTTFPNQGLAFGYIIFDPSGTTPPLTSTGYEAYSGTKYAAHFAQTTGPDNSWLVTPQLSIGENMVFKFMGKSITANYGLERFNVYVSTTGNAISDFVKISEGTYLEAPVAWTEYSYDLSDYAGEDVYLAIQCVSNDAFMLMVDDVFIGTPEAPLTKTFTGFNIYLDDMNTPVATVTDTEYLFTELEGGTYTAGVQSVYTTGVSEIVTIDFEVEGMIIPTYTVTFEVTDEDENPITDAVITLESNANDAGDYVFANLETGTYSYLVEKEGYFDATGEVVVTDEDVLVTVTLIIDDTGMPGQGSDQLKIYPVPAQTTLYITSPEVIRNLRIIDMLGQVAYATSTVGLSHEVNVSEFKSGIYFVQILTDKGMETRRIQVQK